MSCFYRNSLLTYDTLPVVSNGTITSTDHHWDITPMSSVFIGITCDALPVVGNGTITSTGHYYNNTAWLQCDPDHRTLYGYTDVWMTCQADGTWNVSMEQLSCGGK